MPGSVSGAKDAALLTRWFLDCKGWSETGRSQTADRRADGQQGSARTGETEAHGMADGREPRLDVSALPRWRNLGPHRGGRVVAVAGHPTEPAVFWMGSTGGGVWKTTNAGVTWHNLTDGQMGSASVGALAVAPSDPNVLYAGMGESCIRGNVSFGDGVYRSHDGGRTWQHRGLAATEHIARVRVHPSDPDRVYAAVLGHAFGPHSDRGVYRSQDGGQHWDKVLGRDENTGAIDLSMDPTNPRVLYASLWEARRQPWSMKSGGPGTGLFRSFDGGDTWEEITRRPGMPEGTLGRIGVAASPRPGRVYILAEAEEGGVLRSDDYGDHWKRTNEDRGVRSRPWYYSHLFADPTDPETVYALASTFYRSTDAGRSFAPVATPHSDHHDLWIDPANPRRMIHGADGGAAVSLDGGASWSSIYNQPTGEFYHVVADTRFPPRIYGAQQDNTTLSLPSASDSAGIGEREWYDVGGAESGYIAVRPDDPDVVFAGSSGGGEGGRITRYDHRIRQQRDVSVWPEQTAGMAAREYTYRFQWTSPILLSPHDPQVLYSCGNHVFRSRDEGETWECLSPDLTRNDPDKMGPSGGVTVDHTGVEVYCTLFAFAESPLRKGMLWAGSDDGLVHVSRDDGKTWTDVTPPAELLPEWATVSLIEPSHTDPEVCYLAAHRYRLDDRHPYLLATRDGGRTWQSLAQGLPDDVYLRAVREDPEVPGVLYVAGETGIHVSLDDGATWNPLGTGLPVVPVHDIAVTGSNLMVASHGRGFWELDDVTPIRQAAREQRGSQGSALPDVRAAECLYAPRDTPRVRYGGFLLLPGELESLAGASAIELPEGTSYYLARKTPPGEAPLFLDAGQNPPTGVLIHYILGQPADSVTVRILDRDGGQLETFASDVDAASDRMRPEREAGAHRFVWNFRLPGAATVTEGVNLWKGRPLCAPEAVPGPYAVELETTRGEVTTVSRASLRILADPRVRASQADLEARFAVEVRIRDTVTELNGLLSSARRLARELDSLEGRAQEADLADRAEADLETVRTVREGAKTVEAALTQTRWKSMEDHMGSAAGLDAQLVHLFSVVTSADARPTRASLERLEQLAARVSEQGPVLQGLWENARRAEHQLLSLGLGLLPGPSALAAAQPVP